MHKPKGVVCVSKYLHIPQKGVLKVTITHKGIEFWCSFFLVPGNGSALLGMPECKRLQLLNMNCSAIAADWNRWQVNDQSKQYKSTIW